MRGKVPTYLMAAFLVLAFCGAVLRGSALHKKYPDPPIVTYVYEETAQLGGYEITFCGWQWGDSAWSEALLPGADIDYRDETGRQYGARVGLVELSITKVEEGADRLDLSDAGFSSGAWGNQFDMELFYQLNPTLHDMVLDLAVGQTQQVTLPLTLNEAQFPAEQWADIDSRTFYMDLQYYPEHIRFACPCV
jgi:hypothetical protein